MTTTWKVDLHIHTCASPDAATTPAKVVETARRRGLDRICITDHNTIEGALIAQELAPELVIVGEEIIIDRGCEILAFFVSEWVPPRLSYQETLARLQAQGAVISISHPFDRHRNQPWPEELLETILPHIDAIEGFNARTVNPAYNRQAQQFARKHKLPVTAGSDAHTLREVGTAYLQMPPFNTAQEFRAALPHSIPQGRLSPTWVHFFSAFNTLRGRWGLKPRLQRRTTADD